MKKVLGLIIISAVLASPVFAVMPDSFSVNGKAMIEYSKGLAGPLPAIDVKLVKKTPLLFIDVEMKGNPTAQSQGKKPSGQAATGLLGAGLASAKYAIVIGICDYPGTSNDICWSDGDSVNMYDALTTLYGYDPANVYLLRDTYPDHPEITDGAATYNDILQAVNTIRDKEVAGDEVVFFFSGHGGWLRDENGNTIDAEPYDEADGKDEVIIVHDSNEIVGILDDTLRLWFSDFETTRIAFVFDTCLAGGQNDVAANGRVVSMATGENQSAYVYSTGDSTTGELGEGVFSHYFVNEGMLQGKADKYDHGYRTNPENLGEDVVVEEAFDYAKANIPPYLKVRQKPVISDGFYNDLLL